VTVSAGEQGPRVLDLDRDDFTIVDDGDRQQVVTFARGDIPFTATLLIDASASMYGAKLEAATEGARSFVRGMAPLDQAKVMAFSHRILSESPFTDSADVLAGALSGTQAWGGTAINDHLYLAIKTLEARQGRRVVVLLSDGVDSHSALTMEQVQEQARRGQTLLYWLRLTRPGDVMAPDAKGVRLTSAWRTADEYRRQLEVLVDTVEESGGRIVPVQSLEEIRPAFAEILRELREQYVLGYYPTSSRDDGSWHRVRVSVARPGVEVRAHRGYIDL
jgi:Ca-activated chloride channel family protein